MNLAEQMAIDARDPDTPAQPSQQRNTPQLQVVGKRPSLVESMEADIKGSAPVASAKPIAAPATPATAEDDSGPLLGVVGHQLTAGGAALKGGLDVAARYGFGAWEGLTKLLSTGSVSEAGKEISAAAEDAPGILRKAQEEGTYQPEPGTSAAKVSDMLDEYGPGALVQKGFKRAAEKAQDAGAPPWLATAIEETPLIAGAALGLRGAPGAIKSAVKGEAIASAKEAAALRARVEPTLDTFGKPTGEALIRQNAPSEPVIGVPLSEVMRAEKPIVVTPREEGPPPNQVQTIEGGPGYRAGEAAPTEASTAKATPEKRIENAKLLRRLGLDETRESAISEDPKAANTDYNASQPDTVQGKRMFNLLEKERAALKNTAHDMVVNTGKDLTATPYQSGKSIVEPLNGLEDWFDKNTSRLYAERDKQAAGIPVNLEGFSATLARDSLMTNEARVSMRKAVTSYAKEIGLLGEDGTLSGNALQAETMRKYLNSNWSPQNSGLVEALKDSLDHDVLESAGENIHAPARAMWALKKATLDNPNGINKLLSADGINRKVEYEKIPDYVSHLGQDQFSHIVTTLNKISTDPELAHLQPSALQALNEIKGQFAQKIHDYGDAPKVQWGADSVKNYLQNNRAKMKIVFSPEEMARFEDLDKGGQLLAKPTKYPGSEPQKQNLIAAGVMKSIPMIGAAAGESVAPSFGLGAATGAGVGNWVKGKAEDAAAARAFNKRMVKLSDLLRER